jgi:hypothetical protein
MPWTLICEGGNSWILLWSWGNWLLDGVMRFEWIWDLGMADAVVELTFDRPAFTLRTVS